MSTRGLAVSRRLRAGGLPLPRTVSLRGSPSWICRSCYGSSARGTGAAPRNLWAPVQTLTDKIPALDTFARRHIGPDELETKEMLEALSPPAKDLDEFVTQVVPPDILTQRPLFPQRWEAKDSPIEHAVHEALPESEVQAIATRAANSNRIYRDFIGAGYYGTNVPEVIKRNVLENPAWYTSYTPYQPEISQGRLESLLNFQTMVTDLTALPIANASLLDEGTAASEAMTLSMNALSTARAKREGKTFVVSHLVHPQTLSVLMSRAEGFGIRLDRKDVTSPEFKAYLDGLGDDLVGVMVQYPDTEGGVEDFRGLAEQVHEKGALLSCATDLLALTVLTPPGEWGADIAFGNSQRFGVPMGFGGPHAAFFAVAEKHKRKMPGRLVGVSKDRLGNRALRLALQTREQHIRREKATSNVCTAQALLANMSALFAIYHGPEGLRAIAEKTMRLAKVVRAAALHHGLEVRETSPLIGKGPAFDTIVIRAPRRAVYLVAVARRQHRINVRFLNEDEIALSVDETTSPTELLALMSLFNHWASALQTGKAENTAISKEATEEERDEILKARLSRQSAFLQEAYGQLDGPLELPDPFRRKSAYLTHPVFNTHHSETEMLRYIHHLASKDLSLVHSMIPLGSCTMKLNGSVEMSTITLRGFSLPHPFASPSEAPGYNGIIRALSDQLRDITGMDAVSLQPNSGAQGEFAGLRAIRSYHKARGEARRDICLIPVSAHGTNPASAAMAGMRVVPVKCNAKTGNLDLEDLTAKCKQHANQLGAIMVTYPSTYGVFEPGIKRVCEIVHEHGGLVYMDGANMNAQIGLCSPGEIGADVCHLNLHKTFCIPHGGGGPGVGPICVKAHLKEHLPTLQPYEISEKAAVSSAPYGSAGILPISWAYNLLMGADGLKRATQLTLLNANYLLARLRPHYSILYTNEHGRCAHEFILDARPFHASAGIEAIDIAKRLQDYGFHAPTMSWPVPNTLMIEPTESESKAELDRFADALISIRAEIREIEEGRAPRERNVLKMAPHPVHDVILGDGGEAAAWDRPYSREKAAYPLPWLREKKFWPTVARVDDVFGDSNLFCTCPPVEDTTGGTDISSVQ